MADAIEIDVNGKNYRGTYTVETGGDKTTVTHDDRSKTVKLSRSAAAVAPTILRDLVTGT